MKLFEKIDFEIPIDLRPFVMAVAQVETLSAVKATMPAPPTGFPLLFLIYGDYPKLNIQERVFYPTDVPLNIAGQIDISGIEMEVDGIFGQIGLVLHPLAPYYLLHLTGKPLTNNWKGLIEILPNDSRKLFDSISNNQSPHENISIRYYGSGVFQSICVCRRGGCNSGKNQAHGRQHLSF